MNIIKSWFTYWMHEFEACRNGDDKSELYIVFVICHSIGLALLIGYTVFWLAFPFAAFVVTLIFGIPVIAAIAFAKCASRKKARNEDEQ